MAKGYTAEERQAAGRADLFLFIQFKFPNEYIKQGNSIRLKADHSVSIKRGYSGYFDFSKGEGGSGIDMLVNYFGFSLVDAVRELAGFNGYDDFLTETRNTRMNQFIVPDRSPSTDRIERYLTEQRGIDGKIIEWLIGRGLLFEDDHHNAVFLNSQKDFLEKRGTYGKFHQIQKRKSDYYWSFGTGQKIYVCESSIDAISLYDLRREKACYCSIGGVANYCTIDKLRTEFEEVVLAVDNDAAGEHCRHKFTDLPYIIPQRKDWNEDLLARKIKKEKVK